MNDKSFLQNFKGIREVGPKSYKTERSTGEVGNNEFVGDSLGHDSAVEMSFKLTHKNMPLFNHATFENKSMALRPMLWANFAFVPDSKPDNGIS